MDKLPEIDVDEETLAKLRKRLGLSQGSPVWKFCNSNFGIFLMSTVFISLFSWGYSQWTASREHHEEREQRWQKLQVEISNRITYAEKMTHRFPSRDYKVIREAIYGRDPLANVNPSWILHYSPVFPEYKERSFSSLLWELQSMSRGKRVATIASLRNDVYKIEEYFDHLQYSEIRKEGQKDPDEFYQMPQGEGEKCEQGTIEPLKAIQDMAYED